MRTKHGTPDASHLFAAEAAYADSIFRSALRDGRGCVDALRRSLEYVPTYAPAILALGTAEYQLGHRAKGRRLLFSLFDLPEETEDLLDIIDKAGDFMIHSGRYSEGLAFYRRAAARYPKAAVFHQGVGCCAGHEARALKHTFTHRKPRDIHDAESALDFQRASSVDRYRSWVRRRPQVQLRLIV